jgi:hypothetical protein
MDIPGAANGTFAVGVSAFQELHDRTASGRSSVALEPLVAVTIGMTVLGEHLAVGGAGALVLALAVVVVMLIATIALARDAAAHEEELIPQPAPVPR